MQVRRIVTGHDEHGRSVFLSDADAPRAKTFKTYRATASPNCGRRNLEAKVTPISPLRAAPLSQGLVARRF